MPAAGSVKSQGHAEVPEVKEMDKFPSTETVLNQDVKVKSASGGFLVEAQYDGFYGRVRRKEGDKFVISSIDHVGEWMKFCDPKLEMERQSKKKK